MRERFGWVILGVVALCAVSACGGDEEGGQSPVMGMEDAGEPDSGGVEDVDEPMEDAEPSEEDVEAPEEDVDEPQEDVEPEDEVVDMPPEGIEALSDEFDAPGSMEMWQRRHEVEGTEAQYTVMDISETSEGALTIVPTTSGWFADYDGPFLFKEAEGDFVVETLVNAGRVGSPELPPTGFFNSAGLLARDPDHGPDAEDWIMTNLGMQAEFVGSEGKTTVQSESVLTLLPFSHRARIRICRVGATFIVLRREAEGGAWEETHRFERPDMPERLQIGLITNGWNSRGVDPDFNLEPDLIASFDYIRFARPGGMEGCSAEMP